MEYNDFKQAKDFIYKDIEREILLAKGSSNIQLVSALETLGIPPGGGNFLAALGLLSYTEFFGKLKFNYKKSDGSSHASRNFNEFFDELGDEYKSLRSKGLKVYDVFRCGLAHQYYVKEDCTIYMVKKESQMGLGKYDDGNYYFVVETYFEALKAAIEELEKSKYRQ